MATDIHPGWATAHIDGDFVVFLIGMRVNAWWKMHRWLPVARAMPRMLRELEQRPELGYLGGTTWLAGRSTLTVQYWRSLEALESFAHDPELSHRPAWRAFHRGVGAGGDVGIWHESYLVRAGNWEVLYGNMPAFGLGAVATHLQGRAKGTTSAARRAAGAA